ncbi:MAG: sialate O-acetylesterase [Verrucomicrobiota bacterium]
MKYFIFLALLMVTTANAETNSSAKLPAKQNLKIYLLMGQSNMAGRGVVEEEDKIFHPRVFVFTRSNQWELAVEPLTVGEPKKTPGVGPGLAFGKAMAEATPGISIGLVPCAVGGTPLKRWVRGADLYSNAVVRAKAAAEFGTIAGIIWHQGEADSGTQTNAKTYGERLTKMIGDIRADLNSPKLPFVVGQTGEFNYTRPGNPQPFARQVNETLAQIPEKVPFTSCVLSKGLTSKADLVHFDTKSQRELGQGYAREMLKLESRRKITESDRKLLQN